MRCPVCQAEPPLWARLCAQCGTALYAVPPLEGPADLAVPAEVTVAPPAPGPATEAPRLIGVHDFRPHITVGALLAFISTLVIPPLFGAIAVALGLLAFRRGGGRQRRQGAWVMVAGVAGTVIGLAVAYWVDQSNLLG